MTFDIEKATMALGGGLMLLGIAGLVVFGLYGACKLATPVDEAEDTTGHEQLAD